MNNDVDLSIIIVSYNTKELLRDCLNSIYRSTKSLSFEVFVVDNRSPDGSAEMVRNEFGQVTLIANSRNMGFAAANNQAIRVAVGRFILLLNPDTLVFDDSIEKMVRFLEGNGTVGAVGCRIVDPQGVLQRSTRDHYPTLFTTMLSTWNFALSGGMLWIMTQRLLNVSFLKRRAILEDSSYNDAYGALRETSVIIGCCLMVRREVIDTVGMMDEHFFLGTEETEWCLRIGKGGWKLSFLPDAEIMHYGKASMKQTRIHRFEYHKNAHYFLKKHSGKSAAAIYRTTLPLAMILGILVHSGWAMLASQDKSVEMKSNVENFWHTLLWCFTLDSNKEG